MFSKAPVLHLLCGKIASGKSTLASRLGSEPRSVVISEDAWLGALFADQMSSGTDYLKFSAKLQAAMAPHVIALLKRGTSVVLDFPANTIAQRRWMRDLVNQSGAAHQLHFLDIPDEVCLQRLSARNAEGEHAFAATEEQFRRFTAHFVPPTEDEGFRIVRH